MPKITTRLRSNLVTCRFEVDAPLHQNGAAFFRDKDAAKSSPLAEQIFAISGVTSVKIKRDSVEVTRESYENWPATTRAVAPLIEAQLASGKPAVAEGTPTHMPSDAEIKEKLEEVLEVQINPAVASHGGAIHLLDVRDGTAYVQLTGGCQGCGSAQATLKQGVERSFRDAVPELDEVLDTTDHAAGANPYYSAPVQEEHGHSHGGGGGCGSGGGGGCGSGGGHSHGAPKSSGGGCGSGGCGCH